jgi:class 3 adenylate cyclase
MHRDLRRLGVEIRAGLHAGEVERVDLDDIAGMAANVAARVSALAGGGQTLATRVLSDLLVGTAIVVDDAGVHRLKGVPGDVAVVELHAADVTVDLTTDTIDLRQSPRLADAVTLRLAQRAPAFMRGLARLTGAN